MAKQRKPDAAERIAAWAFPTTNTAMPTTIDLYNRSKQMDLEVRIRRAIRAAVKAERKGRCK